MTDNVKITSAPTRVEPADFVSGGDPAGEIEVRISYGIIDRFSEGLYSSPNKAFEELVSNAYDAGARRVWVWVPPELDESNAYLAVIDDGISMDLDGLEELWKVGVSPKRLPDGTEIINSGRRPIGKFGIGKLATYVLAEKLTYICRSADTIRAVTMDFGRVHGEMTDPTPMALTVVQLSSNAAQQALEEALGASCPAPDILFHNGGVATWTVAILSDLKPRGRSVQSGRLRWILRSALPLGDTFRLWLNNEELTSTKVDASPVWEFVVGESDKTVDGWSYASLTTTDSTGRPGVELPDVGFVRGTACMFEGSLKGGKSDERGRSHGFFVKIRDRLVNLNDETFGIDVELSHGVLTRFRMDVFADGLDEYLSSPRESVQESAALTSLRAYMHAIFNRARVYRANQEEKGDKDLLASTERIAHPPAALSTGPLRRVLRRVIAGDTDVSQLLDLDESDVTAAPNAVETHETLLRQVLIEPLGYDKPLVRYSVEKRAAIVNANHPFISNYLDIPGAQEPLRLVGVTELLTQVYMLDEDLDPPLVRKILRRRDEFLRALTNIHPRSALVIARQLRDAKSQKDELEDALADALELLGFDVTRLGGNGRPDGIARAQIGARAESGGTGNYAVTYDAKSSGKDAIKAATAGTQTLRKHRTANGAQHSLLIAPGYQGAEGEDTSIIENCTCDKITPVTVDQLAEVVELFPFRSLTPASIRPLFELYTPAAVAEWVTSLRSAEVVPTRPPIYEILKLTQELSDRQDAVTIDALSAVLATQHHIEIAIEPLRALVRGLAALAPDGLWYEHPNRLALNASIPTIIKELSATIEPLDEIVAGVFKSVLAETGGTDR